MGPISGGPDVSMADVLGVGIGRRASGDRAKDPSLYCCERVRRYGCERCARSGPQAEMSEVFHGVTTGSQMINVVVVAQVVEY